METLNPQLLNDSATANATARLRAQHYEETSLSQRAADRITSLVSRPGLAALLTVAILLWTAGNVVAGMAGTIAVDPPPFVGLQCGMSAAALYVAVLILTTQRRQDQLASHREQLALELAILNEQKVSKVIELLEELRRDSPTMFDRTDHEAANMSTPSDPHSVLAAIKSSQRKEH